MSMLSRQKTLFRQPVISRTNGIVVGPGGLHTDPTQTSTAFETSSSIHNPNLTFMGALSGYIYYDGAQGASCGSIQGGACEAYVAMTGSVTQAVLGWESAGAVVGTGSYQNVIGGASTVQANDQTTVQNLIGYQGRGPVTSFGTPTVTNAYTMKNLEPTTGNNRWTYYGTGRHTFCLGADSASNVVEIQGTSAILRWGVNAGGVWTGYATDGASTRMVLDPGDSPTYRFKSDIYSGTGQHLALFNGGSQVFGIEKTGQPRFYDALKQTTVGAAGTASALPGAPTCYFQVKTQSGTLLVIPAYLAS